ncbi:MAG: ketoacyl-ACP synthase III [Planctomycetia bacterium]|nr:ketoacyl-ACP synthase III [Planctomycetia bacterium]
MGIRALATGAYVPDNVVTNERLQELLGCDPNWLIKLTGIRQRRHAAPHQATSDLCVEAARQCLERAAVDPTDVDQLIVATVTPDMSFPSTACLVQDRLGIGPCTAYDLNAACSGFLYGVVQAASAIVAGASDLAMVIGGEVLSRVVNPHDFKTYPLFGDGAGAILLSRGTPQQGLLRYTLGADGAGAPLLQRKGFGSRMPPSKEALEAGNCYLTMDGRAVFTWAVGKLCDTVQEVLRSAELGPGDVDLYIPHQANIRIINAALDVIGIPRGLVIANLERYGNTSAASVPLALNEAIEDDRVRPGDRIVLSGFGAGLTWGTAVWQW